MKKLIFLSVIYAMSLLMDVDGFTTSNNLYICELGQQQMFTDSSDGKEYYMALFFCKSTKDNLYKFISYNLYSSLDQSSLTHSVDIGFPPSVGNIKSIDYGRVGWCALQSNISTPGFVFTMNLLNSENKRFERTLRICHSKGKILINYFDSLWFKDTVMNHQQVSFTDVLLSAVVYDPSN